MVRQLVIITVPIQIPAKVKRNNISNIRNIFRMGVEHGKDSLALAVFGFGAYALLPDAVAPFYQEFGTITAE